METYGSRNSASLDSMEVVIASVSMEILYLVTFNGLSKLHLIFICALYNNSNQRKRSHEFESNWEELGREKGFEENNVIIF